MQGEQNMRLPPNHGQKTVLNNFIRSSERIPRACAGNGSMHHPGQETWCQHMGEEACGQLGSSQAARSPPSPSGT